MRLPSLSALAVFALGLAQCAAARHGISSPHAHEHARSLLHRRDAYNQVAGNNNQDGGIKSGPLPVPAGSRLRNFTVGARGEELVTYWSNGLKDADIEMLIFLVHGRGRDGDNFWRIGNTALRTALRDNVPGAINATMIVAPQFMSTIRNKGRYRANQIAFADVNAWQPGERATHPSGTQVTSYSAVNAFLNQLANKSRFPKLRRVVLVGHGGGAQMMTRYSVLGSVPASSVFSTRFVIGDPSTNLYFTANRPLTSSFDARGHSKSSCPLYNTFRYGFDKMRDSVITLKDDTRSPRDFFAAFARRDVWYLVGEDDTDASGDQTCMGILAGGVPRRDRNLMYYKYINLLAGTGRDLSRYPGAFVDSLPNWSSVTGGKLNAKLTTVPNAGHDGYAVFTASQGRTALFSP